MITSAIDKRQYVDYADECNAMIVYAQGAIVALHMQSGDTPELIKLRDALAAAYDASIDLIKAGK